MAVGGVEHAQGGDNVRVREALALGPQEAHDAAGKAEREAEQDEEGRHELHDPRRVVAYEGVVGHEVAHFVDGVAAEELHSSASYPWVDEQEDNEPMDAGGVERHELCCPIMERG